MPNIIKVSELAELTTSANDDFFIILDTSETIEAQKIKKIKKQNISSNLVEILQTVYPVGSIYTSTIATNPATLFGFGTWVAFGAGRALVGIDTTQTEFDTIKETGGAKSTTLTPTQMPVHTHAQDAHNHYLGTQLWRVQSLPSGGAGVWVLAIDGGGSTNDATAINQNAGGGGAHDNLQPYIVVRFWERTA